MDHHRSSWVIVIIQTNPFHKTLCATGRIFFWAQLWAGQNRKVHRLDELLPAFPEAAWPVVEVVIAHYQEPVDELAGVSRLSVVYQFCHLAVKPLVAINPALILF